MKLCSNNKRWWWRVKGADEKIYKLLKKKKKMMKKNTHKQKRGREIRRWREEDEFLLMNLFIPTDYNLKMKMRKIQQESSST